MRSRKTSARSTAPVVRLVGGVFAGVPITGPDGRASVLVLGDGQTIVGQGPGRPPVAGDAAAEAFPIGSLFSAAVPTNPSTLLGYGTWELWATGQGASGAVLTLTRE
jgi:hypothetical protein